MQRSSSSADFLNLISNFNDSINGVNEIKLKEEHLLVYLQRLQEYFHNPEFLSGGQRNIMRIYESIYSRMSLLNAEYDKVLVKALEILSSLWKLGQSSPTGPDSVNLFVSSCLVATRNPSFLPTIHSYFKEVFVFPPFIESFLKSDGLLYYITKLYTIDVDEIIVEQTNKILNIIPAVHYTTSKVTSALNQFAKLGKLEKIQPRLRKLASILIVSIFDKLKVSQGREFTFNDFPDFNSEFLLGFIVHLNHETLANLILENRRFIDMSIEIFKQKESKIHQSHIVRALLETNPYLKNKNILFMIISDYITAVPAERTVEPILSYMTDFKCNSFCDVFLSCFVKTVEISEAFVKCDGIEWLEDMRVKGIVDMELYSQMLSSLVVLRRFDDLDDFIDDLDQSHPIFSLGKQQLDKIVYGMKTSRYRPIRVPSLFPLLDPPSFIDPYNAWMLGNCVVSQYLRKGVDIFDIPFIIDIGNRYIKTKHVNLLMSRPFELKKFCNAKHMHYPLFQFYQGREELKYADTFSAISFWFQASDEQDNIINIFHTDNVLISIDKSHLYITIDDEKFVMDFDCHKMTFIYVSLQEKLFSTITHVYFRSANHTEMMKVCKPKKDKNPFTYAGFGWIGRGLLFLGASIRVYKNRFIKPDVLFAHGPEFIDYTDSSRMELIITPYTFCNPSSNEPNSSNDTRIVIPPNFVAVPYFGLPFHFLSMRKISGLFKMLGTAQTSEQYLNLFSTLMRITQITYFNSLKFWPKILASMKKHRQFINRDFFLKALKSASYHSRRDRILASILFDDEMWEFVDNEILIAGLFDYFNDMNWSTIEGFDHFLATKVLKNPKNVNIVDMILQKHKDLPNLIKIMTRIVSFAHVLNDPVITWDGIVNSRSTDVQLTLIQGFTNFINQQNVDTFISFMSFNYLTQVMYNSTPEASIKIYHMMATANIFKPGYMTINQPFLVLIAKYAYSHSIWTDTFLLATDNFYHSECLLAALPLLLVLVWAFSLCLIHKHSFPSAELSQDLSLTLSDFKNAISILSDNLQYVFADKTSTSLLTSWFPLIFSYTGYLQTMCESQSLTPEILDLPKDKTIDIIVPPPQQPQKANTFMLSLVKDVLNGFGLEFPVSEPFDSNGFVKFIEEFYLTHFMALLIYKAPEKIFNLLFGCLYCNLPFYDQGRTPLIIQPLIHILMANCHELTPTFPLMSFLNYLVFFVSNKCFSDKPVQFFSDLFSFIAFATKVIKNSTILSCAKVINIILFDVFMHSPHNAMTKIVPLFARNVDMIAPLAVEARASKAWYYAFFLISKTDAKEFDQFIEKFTSLLPNDHKESKFIDAIYESDIDQQYFSTLESAWKVFIEILEKFEKENSDAILSSKGTFSNEITQLSRDITSMCYQLHTKHLYEAIAFKKSLLTLESTFTLNEQRTKWKLFITSLRDKLSYVVNFDPVCYHLSPRCLPFSAPRIFTPSTIPPVNGEMIPVFPYSAVLSLYTHNTHQTSSVTLLELFKRINSKYGAVISFMSCELIRYDNRIPCVIFLFKSMIMFLTYASTTDDGRDILLKEPSNEKVMHTFIESVLIGHWGTTQLFNTHIVICIPNSSLISARKYDDNTLAIWTFKSGHFLLTADRSILFSVSRLAFDSFSTPSNSFIFNIRKSEEIYYYYTNGKISTEQMLLAVNCFAQRSFVDLNRVPFFPYIENGKIVEKKIPDRDPALTFLGKMLPFTVFTHNHVNVYDYCIPAHLFYAPDVNFGFIRAMEMRQELKNVSEIKNWVLKNFYGEIVSNDLSKIKDTPRKLSSVAFINNIHVCQSINRSCAEHQTLLFERNTVRKISKLSARIEPTHPYYIRIDKRLLTMTMLNKETGQIFFSKMDYLMIFADAVSISANGLFLVVDFEFGLTRIYKINFIQSIPSDYSLVSELSWDLVPQSVISGIDFICATAVGARLVLWEFTYGSLHRYKDFDEKIQHISMDEKYGIVWIATDTKLMCFSLNMEMLAELSIENITCLEVVPHPSDCTERNAILGFENGGVAIALLRFDIKSFEIKNLPSEHEYPVDRIATHPSLEEFLSIDEEGNALLWNAFGVTGATQKLSIYDSCPYCGDKVAAYCNKCNRTVCAHCMSESNPKSLCAMCAALDAYL